MPTVSELMNQEAKKTIQWLETLAVDKFTDWFQNVIDRNTFRGIASGAYPRDMLRDEILLFLYETAEEDSIVRKYFRGAVETLIHKWLDGEEIVESETNLVTFIFFVGDAMPLEFIDDFITLAEKQDVVYKKECKRSSLHADLLQAVMGLQESNADKLTKDQRQRLIKIAEREIKEDGHMAFRVFWEIDIDLACQHFQDLMAWHTRIYGGRGRSFKDIAEAMWGFVPRRFFRLAGGIENFKKKMESIVSTWSDEEKKLFEAFLETLE